MLSVPVLVSEPDEVRVAPCTTVKAAVPPAAVVLVTLLRLWLVPRLTVESTLPIAETDTEPRANSPPLVGRERAAGDKSSAAVGVNRLEA